MFCVHRPFDLVSGFVIDPMHNIFLGVVLQLLKHWFTSRNKPYSLKSKVKCLNDF